MTDEIYPEPTCECSAQLERGQARCRKCLARGRWLRKQTAKRHGRRIKTRRPPRNPRGLTLRGVSWT
ncbi:hypothetical protein ACIBG7_32900 [Nonomuraea sp. NPDC050328]|uniref:hypothetical protein n=1 Tax=Nonomuraea sp. NPDC050328 TaxID=3364361 RepID=UPI0037B77DE0